MAKTADKKKSKQDKFNDYVREILNTMAGDIFRLEKNFVALKMAGGISDDQLKEAMSQLIDQVDEKAKELEAQKEMAKEVEDALNKPTE